MFDRLTIFLDQFKRLPLNQRFAIIGGIVAVVSGMIVVTMFASTPNFQLLYSNISAEDAGRIVEKLKEQKIPYQLSGDGTTIFVPGDKVYDQRISLATEGLPQGSGVGFELFNEQKLGATEFVQKINYQRALTGELSRTIKQFPEVENVRVHITTPDDSLFIEDQKNPTASVILKLIPGVRLKDHQVNGIVHLVSSAVIGLHPEDVTVVDGHGEILAGGKDTDTDSKMVDTQLDLKKKFEKSEESRVTSMLEKIVGPGKAVVRLSVDMNFQKQEVSEEVFDPNSQVARSESTTEDSSQGAVEVKGVPGVVSNVPEAARTGNVTVANQPVESSSEPAKSATNTSVTNYEINKTVKRTIQPVGTVNKLSVAVLVDGKYEMQGEGDAAKEVYVPRTEEELKKINDIVKNALGVTPDRGDTIEVANVPFDTTHLEKDLKEMSAFEAKEFWIANGKYAVSAILILVLFLFVLKPLLKWITGPVRIEEEEPHKTVSELEMEDKELEQSLEMKDRVDYRQLAQQVTKDDPEKVAEFIRKWIREKPAK